MLGALASRCAGVPARLGLGLGRRRGADGKGFWEEGTGGGQKMMSRGGGALAFTGDAHLWIAFLFSGHDVGSCGWWSM